MKKKLLICDDDKDILELTTFILSKEYDVTTTTHVRDILERVKTSPPDLILMDLWIPDIGGAEAVKLLKNNKDTKSIPIIIFSANDEIENISIKVKANSYIKKPFSVKGLKGIVKKFI